MQKTKGNLHVAAGSSLGQQHSDHQHHIHRLTPADLTSKFNVSHRIIRFAVVPSFPEQASPLNGALFVHQENQIQLTYYLKMVPTLYEPMYGSPVMSYQYSVAENKKVIDFKGSTFPLPGLFIKWEFSPFMVKTSERGYTFSRFLTRVCAVVGGTFVVLGLVYRVLHGLYNVVKEKSH